MRRNAEIDALSYWKLFDCVAYIWFYIAFIYQHALCVCVCVCGGVVCVCVCVCVCCVSKLSYYFTFSCLLLCVNQWFVNTLKQ